MTTLYAPSKFGYVKRSTDRDYRYWVMTVTRSHDGYLLASFSFSGKQPSKPSKKNFIYWEWGYTSSQKPDSDELTKSNVSPWWGWIVLPAEAEATIAKLNEPVSYRELKYAEIDDIDVSTLEGCHDEMTEGEVLRYYLIGWHPELKKWFVFENFTDDRNRAIEAPTLKDALAGAAKEFGTALFSGMDYLYYSGSFA